MSRKELKATVDNKIWIPYSPVMEAKARKVFQIKQYDEKVCDRCEYRPERHCSICDECPANAYLGEMKLWEKKIDKDGDPFIGLPIGRPSLLKKVVNPEKYKLRIKDKRSKEPMKHKIKFIGELFKNQKKPVRDMVEKRRGILKAPPRAGKTVMATAIACEVGYKTLILAKQYDWLKQFEETIMGTKNKDGSWKDKPMTNAPKIEEKKGKKIVGFCKDPKEMHKYDIVLATYQSFITKKGKKRLEKIRKMFGTVIIDECDGVPADNYLRVISKLSCKYMVGLTGTVERKDGKHELSAIVLGTVKTTAKVKTMVPRVEVVETEASTSYQYKSFVSGVNYLSKHKKRNEQIAKLAVADIKAGRSLVIPVERVDHVKLLTDMINKRYLAKYGKTVCIGFGGKDKGAVRDKIREGAKKGKIKCVVGMRKMVQRGINVPRWDTLYVVMPISNPPNFEQETSRIRTQMEGKQEPVIKHFLEDFGITKGCFRTCFWQTYKPGGFAISKKTEELAKKYMGNNRKAAAKESPIF